MAMGLGSVVEIPWSLVLGLMGLLLVWRWVFQMLERAWFKPRRLASALRAQGLHGTPYRFLTGDAREDARLNQEARAKPMPLSHDIVPRVAPFFHRNMKENGKISFTWFGPIPRVRLLDPELAREVLSNKFGLFGKLRTPLGRLVADGLLNYEGEKWVRHRRILNPAFHMEKLKRMLPSFSTCCTELIARWESSVSSRGSFELDVWPELRNLTGDVISRTAFGSSYREGRRIFLLQAELLELVVRNLATVHIPGYRFLPTRDNRRMKEIDREVRLLLRGIIGKREKAMKDGEASNDDLLGLLLESNMKYFEENGKSVPKMTTEDVIEECKLFYFAGHETTSLLLTWAIVVLGMHPSWQARAREEVLQVFGRNKPDIEGLSHLKIVTMILYEVLRLYPPIMILNRITHEAVKIGGIVYPAGVLLSLPIMFIHHDPDIWGEDVNEFKPERFAEGISKASKDHHGAFFPFGGGPRICIGQNFALLEAKMGLSTILQRFSFELSPSYIHAPHQVGTLHPQHGAQIILHSLSL
ncbi:cytochrome P450 CYP72A616-like [Typha angustifolia]|uniref:cytochrome P450 CYP72A616-like n=1 Tax=Typha angustifolia TaxID=59011 RepID=UPI003C2DB095